MKRLKIAVLFREKKKGLMSKVIMMCGVCGSGKTTYAKKKEQEDNIRLPLTKKFDFLFC